MEIEILEHVHHRNGVNGNSFNAFRFKWHYENGTWGRFIATVFPSKDKDGYESETCNGLVCVLMEQPYASINLMDRWRGDEVEPALRRFLAWQDKQPAFVPGSSNEPTVAAYYNHLRSIAGVKTRSLV